MLEHHMVTAKYRTVERCDCGDPICEGWAMIPKER